MVRLKSHGEHIIPRLLELVVILGLYLCLYIKPPSQIHAQHDAATRNFLSQLTVKESYVDGRRCLLQLRAEPIKRC